MEDDAVQAGALFALRLSVDLLKALAITGALSEAAATTLLAESLNGALRDHPALAPHLRRIARTAAADLEIAMLDLRREEDRPSPP